jgi:hypothetical protein
MPLELASLDEEDAKAMKRGHTKAKRAEITPPVLH